MTSTWTLFNENPENFRKCATNCAFATEKAEGSRFRLRSGLPTTYIYNYIVCVRVGSNLTATTAKRQEVVKWPVRIPCPHPDRAWETFWLRGAARDFRCSGGLLRGCGQSQIEVKTLAQIITHLSLRPAPPRSGTASNWRRSLSTITGAQLLQPIVQLPGQISYFGIKRLDLPPAYPSLMTPLLGAAYVLRRVIVQSVDTPRQGSIKALSLSIVEPPRSLSL